MLVVCFLGVDVEEARSEEETQMLEDARSWLNAGKVEDIRDRSGNLSFTLANRDKLACCFPDRGKN